MSINFRFCVGVWLISEILEFYISSGTWWRSVPKFRFLGYENAQKKLESIIWKSYIHIWFNFRFFCAWKHSKYCERIVNKIKEKQMPVVLNYAAWSWQQFWLEMKLRKMFQNTHQGTIILTVKTLKILKPSICQNKIPPNAQKHNFFRVKTMTISRWNLREKMLQKTWKDLSFQPS